MVLTKLSRASPAFSSALLTTTYAVTPQKKRVISSTQMSSTVFSVRRQSTPIHAWLGSAVGVRG